MTDFEGVDVSHYIATGRKPSHPESVVDPPVICSHSGCVDPVYDRQARFGLCAAHLVEICLHMRPARQGEPPGIVPIPTPHTTTGWVYYVQLGECIKIGFTLNMERRMMTFRNSHANPVLLAKEPGSLSLERRRHRQFAASHEVRELFRPSAELARHIESLSS